MPPYNPLPMEQFADADADNIFFLDDLSQSNFNKPPEEPTFGYNPHSQREIKLKLRSLTRKKIRALNDSIFETGDSDQFSDADAF